MSENDWKVCEGEWISVKASCIERSDGRGTVACPSPRAWWWNRDKEREGSESGGGPYICVGGWQGRIRHSLPKEHRGDVGGW